MVATAGPVHKVSRSPFLLWGLLLLWIGPLAAQQRGFVPQAGQWEGSFDYRLLSHGQVAYLRSASLTWRLYENKRLPHENHPHQHHAQQARQGHVYRMELVGARTGVAGIGKRPLAGKLNFILGRDRERWQRGLSQFEEVVYPDVYPHIDLHYRRSEGGLLKYEFWVKPGGNPADIRLRYEGLARMGRRGAALLLETPVQTLLETRPKTYWQESGQAVANAFVREGREVQFSVKKRPRQDTLVIDPSLVFSTYSGSGVDNWGFTATPAADGGAYGVGVAFTPGGSRRYPATVGSFQDTFQGGNADVAISRYGPQGSVLRYATYLGGNSSEVPFSTLERPGGELIILGTTGSLDYPVTPQALDTLQDGGASGALGDFGSFQTDSASDIFVSILDSTGGLLKASTLLGDTGLDGGNPLMNYNYGDNFRGDLGLDSSGNIYLVCNARSPGLPTTSTAAQTNLNGPQDGYAASLTPDLSSLRWGSYIGGSHIDALFSLAMAPQSGRIYLSGASDSAAWNPPGNLGGYRSNIQGQVDGLLVSLRMSNGSLLSYTYTGTAKDDLAYFGELGKKGSLYVLGQTYGTFPISDSAFYANPNSGQFLQQFDASLDQNLRSTVFGTSDSGVTNISPTALLIDDCDNLYLSGFMNTSSVRGNAAGNILNQNLPLKNPYQSTTDGEDFYFFSLDASWERLNFASFFGAIGAYDHVDGGSSRFLEDGTIYQGVCAGCGGSNAFPTTPTAFSRVNNARNCNMATLRFDMEANAVKAIVQAENLQSGDTICLPYQAVLENRSINDDLLLVDYPDGRRDTVSDSLFTSFQDTGWYTLQFIALDTNCQLSDTTQLRFYGRSDSLQVGFTTTFDSCQATPTVQFINQSSDADRFIWDFGDGGTATVASPQHSYARGRYEVQLIAIDEECNLRDTLVKEVEITERNSQPRLAVNYEPCRAASSIRLRVEGRPVDSVRYRLNGDLLGRHEDSLLLENLGPGNYRLQARAYDTACGQTFDLEAEWYALDEEQQLEFPNVFTPNGDQQNDRFGLLPGFPTQFLESYHLRIYTRWGQPVYETNAPQDRWDGRWEGQKGTETVFYYLVDYRDICGQSHQQKGFLHLMR